MSSIVIFWQKDPLPPLGWWRNIWTTPNCCLGRSSPSKSPPTIFQGWAFQEYWGLGTHFIACCSPVQRQQVQQAQVLLCRQPPFVRFVTKNGSWTYSEKQGLKYNWSSSSNVDIFKHTKKITFGRGKPF